MRRCDQISRYRCVHRIVRTKLRRYLQARAAPEKALVRRKGAKYACCLLSMSIAAGINGLWLASLALDGFLLAVLIVKGMWKTFPWFTAYCAWDFLETVVFYFLAGHPGYLSLYPIA